MKVELMDRKNNLNKSLVLFVEFIKLTAVRMKTNTPTQKVQILNFPTPFRASQYLIFSPSESTIKAHRKILNVHFRHKTFPVVSQLCKVQATPPKLKMPQFRIVFTRVALHVREKAHCYKSLAEFEYFS